MVQHRRSVIALYAIGMLVLLTAFPGCAQSNEQRRHARMRRRMHQMPEKYKNDGAPKVGDVAYLFKLKAVDDDKVVDLNTFAGKKPVALFFGSYT